MCLSLSSRFSLRSSLLSPRGRPFSLLSSLSALFLLLSSLSALFPLHSLLLLSQIALRTSHFELCIRPSTPLPTASTLCGTILGPNYCLLRPSHLDCDCLSLLASLCALPSSLLGPDPFLYHPALLGPNESPPTNPVSCCCSKSLVCRSLAAFFVISSLFSLLASLAAAHVSERSSHFSLRTLHQTIDSAPNSLDPLRHHSGTELLPSSALSS